MRRYGEAVEILESLDIKKIKLMTNNPAKVEDLEKAGFEVKQIGHSTEPNEENKDYLRTKASKMNHKLEIGD
jgi:GTP cyclohydrolase II